eukprot:TRINITY_DN608_c1_g1_i2.p2 TRINITY_DN608_c1_g1~~TRINITY_DN608_c1_g1_i2.p2  ORF type:complete len:328 (+),score=102.35 TRINITY_DN608_c1_g1_i2:65-985(+)
MPPSGGDSATALLERLGQLQANADEQFLGDYRVVRTLGKGSCGIVKLCEHKRTKDEVAVKIVSRGELDKSPDQRRRTETEIRILRAVDHPCVCKLHEVVETPEHRYIVMDYLKGGELYDLILKRGQLAPEEVFPYFAAVYCAVLHLHHRNIYHRDIKPENILLDARGRLKLCDFGFAYAAAGPGEQIVTECGSPHYAAPEVVLKQPHQPVRAEVWSLGVLLYVMGSSQLPFDAPTRPVLFDRITNAQYKIPDTMLNGVAALVRKMLVRAGRDRVELIDIAADDWFRERLPRLPLELKQALEREIRR